MNRLVKVALFLLVTVVAHSFASAANAQNRDVRNSNFNELGEVSLDGREGIKTAVMLHAGTAGLSSCNAVQNHVRERLVGHIDRNRLYFDYRIGCEANGLFSVRYTFELMIEPKTDTDFEFAANWIQRHNGVELHGENAWFHYADSIDLKMVLMAGMVSAGGQGPLRVVHQKERIHSFINYGASRVIVATAAENMRKKETEGIFATADLVFGNESRSEYEGVLPRANYARVTALPIFKFENGAARNAWYYLFYDHDCRGTPNSMCM